MKAKVYGIRISIGLIVPAIVMIAITTIVKSECAIISLLNNVGIGVLGSSIVVLLISIGEYSVEKKRNLIDYCILAEEAVKQFRSIKYFHFSEETDLLLAFYEEQSKNEFWKDFGRPEETVEKEKLISSYKSASLFLDNSSDEQCDLILDTRLKIKIEELKKSMESYIKVSDYSIKTLINCYSTLYFFTEKEMRRSLGETARDDIFISIAKQKSIIDEKSRHFRMYMNGESNNLAAVYRILKDIQQSLFSVEEATDLFEFAVRPFRFVGGILQLVAELIRFMLRLLEFVPGFIKRFFVFGEFLVQLVQFSLRVVQLDLPRLCAFVAFTERLRGVFERGGQQGDFLFLLFDFFVQNPASCGDSLHRPVLLVKLRGNEGQLRAEHLERGVDVLQGGLKLLFALNTQFQAEVAHGKSPAFLG